MSHASFYFAPRASWHAPLLQQPIPARPSQERRRTHVPSETCRDADGTWCEGIDAACGSWEPAKALCQHTCGLCPPRSPVLPPPNPPPPPPPPPPAYPPQPSPSPLLPPPPTPPPPPHPPAFPSPPEPPCLPPIPPRTPLSFFKRPEVVKLSNTFANLTSGAVGIAVVMHHELTTEIAQLGDASQQLGDASTLLLATIRTSARAVRMLWTMAPVVAMSLTMAFVITIYFCCKCCCLNVSRKGFLRTPQSADDEADALDGRQQNFADESDAQMSNANGCPQVVGSSGYDPEPEPGQLTSHRRNTHSTLKSFLPASSLSPSTKAQTTVTVVRPPKRLHPLVGQANRCCSEMVHVFDVDSSSDCVLTDDVSKTISARMAGRMRSWSSRSSTTASSRGRVQHDARSSVF